MQFFKFKEDMKETLLIYVIIMVEFSAKIFPQVLKTFFSSKQKQDCNIKIWKLHDKKYTHSHT